jgi:membrane-bound lytic murein transglycosylase D
MTMTAGALLGARPALRARCSSRSPSGEYCWGMSKMLIKHIRRSGIVGTAPLWRRQKILVLAIACTALSTVSGSASAAVASPVSQPPKPSPHWDLANLANPRVDQWVYRFTGSLKSGFAIALSRGKAYEGMISQKLAQRNMPQELIYVAMIESNFNPRARSRASAVGLWQFVASTARRFGLTVSARSDDRINPAKSTDAALAYLDQLYRRFGSWYLAAAAYNAGPGRIASALRGVTHAERGSDADFYRVSSRLPAETRDYVPKIIAAARIAKNPRVYGFSV